MAYRKETYTTGTSKGSSYNIRRSNIIQKMATRSTTVNMGAK
jgi:hypothetical protein